MKHPARAVLATAAMLVATAAAGISAVVIPASASAAPASGQIAAVTPVFPPTLVNYFFGELSPASGVAAWQWASSTVSENFANTTSRAVVTGNITLASSNGLAVTGQLGVCYQSGTGAINFGNWELINFTEPAGHWINQAFSGTILPGANGFAPGAYKIGLCVSQTGANLVYDTAFGAASGDVIVAEDSGP